MSLITIWSTTPLNCYVQASYDWMRRVVIYK